VAGLHQGCVGETFGASSGAMTSGIEVAGLAAGIFGVVVALFSPAIVSKVARWRRSRPSCLVSLR
jgi:hypothetical protein